MRRLNREKCHTHTSEPPLNSTGPPACVQSGFSATKVFSSTRVTSTEVVTPFLGKVAAVVEPIERFAVVRFWPATVRAFALVGGAEIVADGEGDGEAVAEALGEGVGVADGVALAEGVAEGVGVDFAAGFTGAFFTGAFLTGFFTTFLAGGFFDASARSPMINVESTPATIVRNFLRPERCGCSEKLSIITQSILFGCSARRYGNSVSSRLPHRRQCTRELTHCKQIPHSYRNLWLGFGTFHIHLSLWWFY